MKIAVRKMDKLQILIVEDELSFAIDLEMKLGEMGFNKLHLRDNYEAGMAILETVPIGLALLDINIDGRNRGFDLARRTLELGIPTIFISAFTDEKIFQQAEATAPMAYLNKPVQVLTLRSLINSLLLGRKVPEGPRDLFVKNGRQTERIPLEHIDCIESDGNYCLIHTTKKRIAQKIPLKKLLESLPISEFLQVHKSWVVRTSKIGQLNHANETLFVGEKEIPIGRIYKAQLLETLIRR